jgi:hypothetical protein
MKTPVSILASAACAAFLFATALSVRVAGAAPGEVSLSWNTCSPIVQDIAATNGTARLFVSVLGNDDTHSAYAVDVIIGSADRSVPDAWRFDEAGCQPTALFSIPDRPDAATALVCPAFQGEAASTEVIKHFGMIPAGTDYSTASARCVFLNSYPDGATSLPGQRYFLAEFRFDHVQSVVGEGVPGVTCGGLETPLCFKLLTGPDNLLTTTKYFSLSQQREDYFESSANAWVTVNGMAGCPAVPARPSTWGQIKSVYRR